MSTEIQYAWKLFRVKKNGEVTSLFINKKLELPVGRWMNAQELPTKGFAVRKGWHCCFEPEAPHLSKKGREWRKVIVKDTTILDRPESQGGAWLLANKLMLLPRGE